MLGIGSLSTRTSPQLSPENPLSSTTSYCKTTINYQRSMSFPSSTRNPNRRFTTTIQSFAETIPKFNNNNGVIIKRPASLYEILRVKETASAVEIKSAYRSLAKRFHPDVATSESDSCDFMEIHKAYTTLSDPTARARYDVSIGVGIGIRGFGYRSAATAAASGGFGINGGGGGFMGQTSRWETDQCW